MLDRLFDYVLLGLQLSGITQVLKLASPAHFEELAGRLAAFGRGFQYLRQFAAREVFSNVKELDFSQVSWCCAVNKDWHAEIFSHGLPTMSYGSYSGGDD